MYLHAPHSHFYAVGRDQINNFHYKDANRTERNAVLAFLKPVKSSYVQPCMPGTRKWMLDKIYDWLDDHQAHNILLLTGSPGAGKSAIASTLVSLLQGDGRLGSGFFFKRDDISLRDPAACWHMVASDLAGCDSIIAKI